MSLIYLDSFNSYATNDIEKQWRGDTGLTYFSITNSGEYPIRSGDQVFAITGNYGWQASNYLLSGETIGDALFGFKYKYYGGDEPHHILLGVANRIGAQFTLLVEEDGSIQAFRGGYANTSLGWSRPNIVKNGVAQQYEIKVKVHDTTGYWYVRIDGEDVFSGENTDTRYQSTLAGFDRFGLGGADTDYHSIEDLYVFNLSGEFNVDFLNGARVDCLHPNAPGFYTDWTPDSGANWSRVSDGGDVNSASYVLSSTDGHCDTYHFQDLQVLSGETTVHGVQVRIFPTDDQISGEVLPVFYDGTKYTGSGELATWNWSTSWTLTTGKAPYAKTPWLWDRDPGGGAWTEATINSGEFGVELNIP